MADLNSLAIFAKVVEAKGFSEAARRLKIPISTVSRRVAELEDQLRVRLLERSTRNLRLTDVGAEVLEHAQRSAELSEAVDSLVSNQLSTVGGVLRLSAPPSISDTLLAPLPDPTHFCARRSALSEIVRVPVKRQMTIRTSSPAIRRMAAHPSIRGTLSARTRFLASCMRQAAIPPGRTSIRLIRRSR